MRFTNALQIIFVLKVGILLFVLVIKQNINAVLNATAYMIFENLTTTYVKWSIGSWIYMFLIVFVILSYIQSI